MTLYDFKTKLDFGQHEGETISDILKNNSTYMAGRIAVGYGIYQTVQAFRKFR